MFSIDGAYSDMVDIFGEFFEISDLQWPDWYCDWYVVCKKPIIDLTCKRCSSKKRTHLGARRCILKKKENVAAQIDKY